MRIISIWKNSASRIKILILKQIAQCLNNAVNLVIKLLFRRMKNSLCIVSAIQFLFDRHSGIWLVVKTGSNYVKFTNSRYRVQKYQCDVNSWTRIMLQNYKIKSTMERYVLVIHVHRAITMCYPI